MSFNKKRLPELSVLKLQHSELGDAYLDQFRFSDALIGPADSMQYLNDSIKVQDNAGQDHIDEILSLLTSAKSILFKRASSKYQKEYNDLEKVINSITNKQ